MEVNVGDSVFVCDHGKPRSIKTVTRVMKRFIELEDGSQWLTDGSGRYPYKRRDITYLLLYIKDSPDLPALLTECDRYNALQKIKNTNFDSLDIDTLIKIVSIINSSVQ